MSAAAGTSPCNAKREQKVGSEERKKPPGPGGGAPKGRVPRAVSGGRARTLSLWERGRSWGWGPPVVVGGVPAPRRVSARRKGKGGDPGAEGGRQRQGQPRRPPEQARGSAGRPCREPVRTGPAPPCPPGPPAPRRGAALDGSGLPGSLRWSRRQDRAGPGRSRSDLATFPTARCSPDSRRRNWVLCGASGADLVVLSPPPSAPSVHP